MCFEFPLKGLTIACHLESLATSLQAPTNQLLLGRGPHCVLILSISTCATKDCDTLIQNGWIYGSFRYNMRIMMTNRLRS